MPYYSTPFQTLLRCVLVLSIELHCLIENDITQDAIFALDAMIKNNFLP